MSGMTVKQCIFSLQEYSVLDLLQLTTHTCLDVTGDVVHCSLQHICVHMCVCMYFGTRAQDPCVSNWPLSNSQA